MVYMGRKEQAQPILISYMKVFIEIMHLTIYPVS